MEQIKKAYYAALGTGDLAVEKSIGLVDRAKGIRKLGGDDVSQAYTELAKRGEKVVRKVTRSKPAKRATEGTKQASRQLKGAVTSVRKALGFEEQRTSTSSRKAS
jgi:hypothetical protein